jgi:hypothetical protein
VTAELIIESIISLSLSRSFFIANYLAGVEAFVDEYWLMIHRAAGWGALRAWLMASDQLSPTTSTDSLSLVRLDISVVQMLVSRRFLKNIEMVQVLKKYNGLVGKNKWHTSPRT